MRLASSSAPSAPQIGLSWPVRRPVGKRAGPPGAGRWECAGVWRRRSTAALHVPSSAAEPPAAPCSVLVTHYSAPAHAKAGHPESPARVEAVLDHLRQRSWIGVADEGAGGAASTTKTASAASGAAERAGIAEAGPRGGGAPPADDGHPSQRLQLLRSDRTASPEELALVHPRGYIEAIRAACDRLQEPVLVDDSTYLAPGSYNDCARSVGAVLDLLDALLGGGDGGSETAAATTTPLTAFPGAATANANATAAAAASGAARAAGGAAAAQSGGPAPRQPQPQPQSGGQSSQPRVSQHHAAGLAVVRPPGHHVLPSRPMGFGVFNAVAIAARYAAARHGVERILIVDFDVHHGNGTMEIFYDDCRTLYVSTHQAGLWPYTGKAREVGAGGGRGATVNVPLPGGSGDAAMREAWGRVVLPAAERFGPQLVLVSAGYDAHWRDPLAAWQLTAQGYHWMCSQLLAFSQRWCPGRLALVLEGGYEATSLAECVEASLEGLLGRAAPSAPPPPPRVLHEEPTRRVDLALQEVCRLHGL